MWKILFVLGPDIQIHQGSLQYWYHVTCHSAYLAHNISDLQHAQYGPMGAAYSIGIMSRAVLLTLLIMFLICSTLNMARWASVCLSS